MFTSHTGGKKAGENLRLIRGKKQHRRRARIDREREKASDHANVGAQKGKLGLIEIERKKKIRVSRGLLRGDEEKGCRTLEG